MFFNFFFNILFCIFIVPNCSSFSYCLFCIYICIYKFVCSNIYIYISIYYIEIYSLIRSSRKTCIHLLLVYARVIDCWLLKIDFRLDICNVYRDIHTYTTYIIQNLYLIRLILFLSSYFFRLLLFRFSFCFVFCLFCFVGLKTDNRQPFTEWHFFTIYFKYLFLLFFFCFVFKKFLFYAKSQSNKSFELPATAVDLFSFFVLLLLSFL